MKQCKIEGCSNSVWSNGVCKNHIPRKPLAQTRMTSTATKSKNIDEMRNFFLDIWKTRQDHKCENCKKWLGNEPLTYMFDHVLEKSKYPDLKYEEENIMYLCIMCHDNKTRGFMSPMMKEREKQLLIKYNLI